MRADEGRYAKLLAGLGPVELARVAVQAVRTAAEAGLEDAPHDAGGEVAAIGRRASALAQHEHARYVDACRAASRARDAATRMAPVVGACAVLVAAASRGAAGWALAAACAELLAGLGADLEAASLEAVEGEGSPGTLDGTSAGASLRRAADVIRLAAGEAERDLTDLAAAARTAAAGLGGELAEIDRDVHARLGGVDPVPAVLRELLRDSMAACGGPA